MAVDMQLISEKTVRALRSAELSQRQAEAIYARGKEAVVFALLELTKQLAEAQGKSRDGSRTPSTPSGMIPVYEKPPPSTKSPRRLHLRSLGLGNRWMISRVTFIHRDRLRRQRREATTA